MGAEQRGGCVCRGLCSCAPPALSGLALLAEAAFIPLVGSSGESEVLLS